MPTDRRTAWAAAYQFHEEALAKLTQMEQEPFWEWMARQMVTISRENDGGALIMALMIAVFEDIEAHEKKLHQTPALVMSA